MNRMKHLLCFLLVATLGSLSFKANAYTERNMLQKAADEATLKNVLVMKQAWVPYPAYTDRAAWDSLMGPNKQRLIAAGEKLLDYKWKLIPATAYLEYERSGNRKIMEVPYDANRQALNALMLAELAEGKGRFIDQLLNGAYMSCEMNSWVLSAHLPRQSSKRSLPDFREQIIDLGSGGYGALMAWVHYFFRKPFDKINPVVSLQMRKAIKERILDPYMNDDEMWWMAFNWKPGEIINNWNPWHKGRPPLSPEIYVEFAGKQYNITDLVDRAKADYRLTHKVGVQSCKIYVKPEEEAAYYVVNKVCGKLPL